jgi:hypothetical protein
MVERSAQSLCYEKMFMCLSWVVKRQGKVHRETGGYIDIEREHWEEVGWEEGILQVALIFTIILQTSWVWEIYWFTKRITYWI